MGFLIDTCIWIEVERGAVAPADVAQFTGDEPVFLSPVTLAELTFGVEMSKDPTIRLKRAVPWIGSGKSRFWSLTRLRGKSSVSWLPN